MNWMCAGFAGRRISDDSVHCSDTGATNASLKIARHRQTHKPMDVLCSMYLQSPATQLMGVATMAITLAGIVFAKRSLKF